LDLAKYRNVFLEEAAEHLGEMSRALLDLEKDPKRADAIDLLFRMAHSIKGMAASLEYDSIAEVAHRLEDRMQEVRAAGHVSGAASLPTLFRGLEGLEAMVAAVRERGAPPPADPGLLALLSAPLGAGGGEGEKKKA
jgi:two-component system chemotaxis sensor kinase CheA